MTSKNPNDRIVRLFFFSTCPGRIRIRLSHPQSQIRFYFAASFRAEISIRQRKLLKVASTPNPYGWNRAVCRAPSLCVWRFLSSLANSWFSTKTHDYQKRHWPNFPVIIFSKSNLCRLQISHLYFFQPPHGLIRLRLSHPQSEMRF